jgi:hypothetical protein
VATTKTLDGPNDKALAIIESWPIMSVDMERVKSLIAENLGGEPLGPGDLTRIKMPSAGGRAWEVPTAGDPAITPDLDVVLIFTKMGRAYWPDAFKGGSTPPECFSDDMIRGSKYGACAACQFNQFGTKIGSDGSPGPGKACKEGRALYFMSAYSTSRPQYIILPPTSLKPMRDYLLRLADQEYTLYDVVTTLSLEVLPNQGGISYSRIKPKLAAPITDPEMAARMREISQSWRPALQATRSAAFLADDEGATTATTNGHMEDDEAI